MYEAALVEYKKVLDLVKGAAPVEASVKVIMAQAFARWGKKSEATKLLADVAGVPTSAYSVAGVHGALGNKDKAFEMLNQAYDEHDMQLVSLKVYTALYDLRHDDGFSDTIRRFGLPA